MLEGLRAGRWGVFYCKSTAAMAIQTMQKVVGARLARALQANREAVFDDCASSGVLQCASDGAYQHIASMNCSSGVVLYVARGRDENQFKLIGVMFGDLTNTAHRLMKDVDVSLETGDSAASFNERVDKSTAAKGSARII